MKQISYMEKWKGEIEDRKKNDRLVMVGVVQMLLQITLK